MGICPSRVLTALLLVAPAVAWADAADGGAMSEEDAKLLKELEAAAPAPAAATAPPAAEPPASRGSNPFSNIFNPALSANGLVLGALESPPVAGSGVRGSLELQEAELQLTSNVDPYFSANLILAIPSGGTLDIEEGYLTAIPQLAGFGFRGGKIKLPFGRENPTHTHALPFVEKSLIGTAVFGDEGLDQLAVEASTLLPLPWYSALTLDVMDGRGQRLFGAPAGEALSAFAATKNVFDLTDDATLEAGLSYTAGQGADQQLAQAVGAHLTFKWRPARNAQNSSLVLTVEGIGARQPLDLVNGAPHDPIGFYGYAQYQLTRGWFLGARYEYLSDRIVQAQVTMREAAILVFVPTEFSAFRLEGMVTEPPGGGPIVFRAQLQANFTIGAHPAHSY